MLKFSVLLVDDEREFVSTLAERMEIRGIVPEVAFSGEQALEILENSVPDVMVLDLGLPRRHGLEVLRDMRARGDDTPVLVLTALGIYVAFIVSGILKAQH